MSETKRATIYFDPDLHRALRVKAATTQSTISALVNEMVRQALQEDHGDLNVFQAREGEPTISYGELLKDLKQHGKL